MWSDLQVNNSHYNHSRMVAQAHHQRNRPRHRSQHHNHKVRKEAAMTFHSDKFFPESKPTGWPQRNFPNQSNRLPNRVWRKQSK